jgi:hypothetical protein
MHYAPKHNEAALLTAAFTAETVNPTVHRTTDIAA